MMQMTSCIGGSGIAALLKSQLLQCRSCMMFFTYFDTDQQTQSLRGRILEEQSRQDGPQSMLQQVKLTDRLGLLVLLYCHLLMTHME